MTDINTNKKKDTSDSTQKTPTKFAIYLNELIDESGESQKKICERADVERTSLNKLLKGTRDKINYKDVQKLADYLNLTVDKRREYFRLYNLSFQGQDTYNNREAVRTLLNHLSSVKFVPTPPPLGINSSFPPCSHEENTRYEMQFAIFSSMKQHILTTLIFPYSFQANLTSHRSS